MKTIYLVAFLFLCPVLIYSQQAMIYETDQKEVSNRTDAIFQQIISDPTTNQVHPVLINFEEFDTPNRVYMYLFGQVFSLQRERLEKRSADDFSWFGSTADGNGEAIISCKGRDVTGVIYYGTAVYDLETLADNTYVIVEVDESKSDEPECGDPDEETIENADATLINGSQNVANNNSSQSAIISVPPPTPGSYSCNLRVLILYTPAAKKNSKNMYALAQEAIATANETYVNSQFGHRKLELVYVNETNYTESTNKKKDKDIGIGDDLRYFSGQGDGYMDEVFDLRQKYSADVCVLISMSKGAAGKAAGIGKGPSAAFCIVKATQAIRNLSFPHEIGHLHGCRHDPYADNKSFPFAYGHGYVNSTKGWRTIMAYPKQCDESFPKVKCVRIPYWSNPYVNYKGDPTGNLTTSYDARVMNEQFPYAITFNQPPAIEELTANSVNINQSYGDVIATDQIYNTEAITVTAANKLYLRATNVIRFLPGFKIESGAVLYAFTGAINECISPGVRLLTSDHSSNEKIVVSNNGSEGQTTVFPNPFINQLTISYYLADQQTVSLFIYDINGRQVARLLSGEVQTAGRHEVVFNPKNLSAGIYVYQLITDGKMQTGKMVKAE